MFNLIKKVVRYFRKVSFFIYKIRQHIFYSFSLVDLRSRNHKIREVAHSIDKSMSMKKFDPSRGDRAKSKLKELCELEGFLSTENALLLDKINNPYKLNEFDIGIELPTVRRFTGDDVEVEKIKKCIVKANKYPKSCSRETVKVYTVSTEKALVANYFSGFSCIEGPYEIAVIVVDLTAYDARAEVFAPYIDGSIFAAGFCRSLWDSGIGSCMLNWSSQSKESEKKLREKLNLNKYDLVIMGIVFGYPEFIPFHAPRKSINELLITCE